VTPTADDGFAWLSVNSITGSLTSFVLAKSNSSAVLETCPAGVLCGLTMRDTFFPTASVNPWSTVPVVRIVPGMTQQVSRNVTASDYCNPLPVLDASIIAGDSTACGDQPIAFKRLPAANGLSSWNFHGVPPGIFLGAAPPKVVFPYAGNFEVLHILNQAGCADTAKLEIRVSDFPALSIPSDTVLCAGQTAFLQVQGAPGTTYHWNDGATEPTRPIQGAGTYALTATNSEGCSSSDSTVVHPPELPVSLAPRDTFMCGEQYLTLELNAEPGWQYAWADGFGEPDRTFSAPGTFYLLAESPEHCMLTDSVVISRRQLPAVSIFAMQPYECGARNLAAHGNSLRFFQWNTGDTSAVISANETGWYTLAASDGFCENTVSTQVEILPCPECFVYIPGVFKPGAGADFRVQSGCIATDYQLRMYDRWGNLLFESRDADAEWNGEMNGRFLPPGVYVYDIRMTLFSGDRYVSFTKTGDVSIVR
jgi:gliding motility-associated-like protein